MKLQTNNDIHDVKMIFRIFFRNWAILFGAVSFVIAAFWIITAPVRLLCKIFNKRSIMKAIIFVSVVGSFVISMIGAIGIFTGYAEVKKSEG